MTTPARIIFWIARLLAALIMLQTLYFTFTGAEESVYIFTQVGMEPWGRIGVGMMELIASFLILVPSTVWLGSVLAAGLMSGALMMHLTLLGIEVNGDGGYLYILAWVVAICSIVAFWIDRKNIPEPIQKFLPSFLH
ncbi:MAG: DoxX family protein [Cyclobacteriaceae bacterium]